MPINTEYLERCIETLEKSYACIKNCEEGTIDYEMYRNSLVKSFEMTLEQAGKLLKKRISPFLASKKLADSLNKIFGVRIINEKGYVKFCKQ